MTEETLTIRTERTPNPNSLKYNVGKLLIPGGSANFPQPETAEGRSPLAEKLFAVKGIVGVFIGSDFFTVTRSENEDWNDLNAGIAPALEAFFESGEQALTGKQAAAAPMVGQEGVDPEMVAQIEKLLDEKIRPAVAQDGGDITYRGYDNGVVYLEMHGACSGCPSSTITLKQGVETMLKHYISTVTEVRAI